MVLDEFLAAAGAYPDRAAVSRNGREISYAEFAARVRREAIRLGPEPGVVGVDATHTPGTVASLLGAWAAGGTYCPVDPAFPARRRAQMLAAAQHAAGAAYVLFTSGSTGAPKPVATPHEAIEVTVRSLRTLFDLSPADRVLQFASLNWDTCFEEILPALTSGACLVFHDDAHSGSFRRFLRMVELEQITVLDLPTAFWHELVNFLYEEGAPLPDCVRLVIIGGEAASPARVADWHALYTDQARLLNTYGCTETTLITHAAELVDDRVPIGWALKHVVERITDDGELLIGGPALALGYPGFPEETARRFVIDGGQRFFRTRDRVSRLPDGALLHEGRIDDELKIRGIRVDPAEVEAHLAGHPAVSAVAVTGLRVADHTVLAAYVVPRALVATSDLDTRLTEYLRDRVPAHLVPSRIQVVRELTYTASGKVDRRRIEESV
jgi:nonribosomal peptide synthetase protein VioO